MTRSFLTLLILLLASACVSDQTVLLRPDPVVEPGTIGQGVTLRLDLRDERSGDVLGRRRSLSGVMPVIRTDERNVMDSFRTALVRGFEAKGFAVSDAVDALAVKLEIRELSYAPQSRLVGTKITTLAVLRAQVTSANANFERLFKHEDVRADLAVTSDVRNEMMINQTVDSLLRLVFEDEEFLDYLARSGKAP